jgi:flavin-binding protein dodecin
METYTGTSYDSFEDAVRQALPDATGPQARSFAVELSVHDGGVDGRVQFTATLR